MVISTCLLWFAVSLIGLVGLHAPSTWVLSRLRVVLRGATVVEDDRGEHDEPGAHRRQRRRQQRRVPLRLRAGCGVAVGVGVAARCGPRRAVAASAAA